MEFPFLIGQSGRGYQKMSLLIYCMKSGGESWDTGQTICKNDYCWNMEIFNTTKNNAYSSFNNCNFKIGLISFDIIFEIILLINDENVSIPGDLTNF